MPEVRLKIMLDYFSLVGTQRSGKRRVLATAQPNKSLDVRQKQLLFKILSFQPKVACGWFLPTSTQSLGCFVV